ncbi:aminotransferase class V-fold PLP-dependent enzyme [Fulvivirgaceae bacterium BMA12]|uniref:Aminotransferase class V-fold PLP-dependent enzyme n=1 Tax=Agaribacillus aureus TaxID=3051825 RepID=A0ABT8L6Y9_9BACT|nr:aminotransferase class V-fold PLP-dependent enzyme [Fulvivirgaceae bacterium BMA12]
MNHNTESILANGVFDTFIMEHYFSKYRRGIIGQNHRIKTSVHEAIKLVYADWTASGRMYLPIERRMLKEVLPFVANTHTDTNYTGSKMTLAYHKAREIIKAHVGATKDDILISSGAGMTGVVNKLQRILGLKIHESFKEAIRLSREEKPIVFVTHMEHHSNHISWNETIADVVIVPPDEKGLVSVENFEKTIRQYHDRKIKIAAITSCSNVTGIITPYMEIAELIHQYNGLCFVDFACSAPYVSIEMHADDSRGRFLDAIYFSPHKFLGGPGATGILIFNKKLYANIIPDNPGGGTVDWTNPWGEQKYCDDIESREDGGTPAFIQTIKAAMCIRLKEEMGVKNIRKREEEILDMIWDFLNTIPNLHILGEAHKKRLGIISFYIDNLHYNLGVKLLNDRFGIQTRGGCSCAGTYGHYLLNVDRKNSKKITDRIDKGDCSTKPGWIRLSIHPTHSDNEIYYMMDAVKQLAENHQNWRVEYDIDLTIGSIKHRNTDAIFATEQQIKDCFEKKFTASLTKA